MPDKELIALLRMQFIPGLGPVGCKKLLAHCGSASEVFASIGQLVASGLRADLAAGLKEESYRQRAYEELQFAEKRGIRCLSYRNPDYPPALLECPDSPVVLFTRGQIRFAQQPLVSVVGTRSMTGYGRELCEAFIAGIAPADPIIISGFAYGVDICAQRTALHFGLQTIAVMAHGLDILYPSAHLRYEAKLLQNGGFITEFPGGTPAEPGHFLRRNRIIAGLSPATVVIESGERGGSLVTADLAFGYNREVFAFPGRVSDPHSTGCNNLIRYHKAQLLNSAGEFLRAMNWEIEEVESPDRSGKRIPEDLGPEDKILAACLADNGPHHLDDLAVRCNFGVSETVTRLFNLEMRGLVQSLPGKKYNWKT